MITVSNLCKSFGGLEVHKGVNVEIDKGDVICVIGPSGSGKSTFLRCLNLLETPTSGSILFEGDELTDKKIDLNRHRQKMGMPASAWTRAMPSPAEQVTNSISTSG